MCSDPNMATGRSWPIPAPGIPVDAFFDKVMVNDDDAKVRENRLKLLNEIRAATRAVADFSKIQD